jgi:hypothetical protein
VRFDKPGGIHCAEVETLAKPTAGHSAIATSNVSTFMPLGGDDSIGL